VGIPTPQRLLDLTGRVAIITGSGKGLGRGIAARFAEAGATVVVNYRSSAAGAQSLVAAIEAKGGRACAIQADVTRQAESERLIVQAVETYGRLDVLINNAGLYPRSALIDMPKDGWDAVVEGNLGSAFLCLQAAARRMIAQGEGGAIVNIASIEGEIASRMHGHYNVAKAGILMLTRVAALELGPHNIRVNAVSPGLIWRPGIERAFAEGVDHWRKTAPLSRLGQPDDVADACLFLASPAARWITGANLRVDGGAATRMAS